MCTKVTVVLVQSFQRCHIGSILNHLGDMGWWWGSGDVRGWRWRGGGEVGLECERVGIRDGECEGWKVWEEQSPATDLVHPLNGSDHPVPAEQQSGVRAASDYHLRVKTVCTTNIHSSIGNVCSSIGNVCSSIGNVCSSIGSGTWGGESLLLHKQNTIILRIQDLTTKALISDFPTYLSCSFITGGPLCFLIASIKRERHTIKHFCCSKFHCHALRTSSSEQS